MSERKSRLVLLVLVAAALAVLLAWTGVDFFNYGW
jgi:hypothetical protein